MWWPPWASQGLAEPHLGALYTAEQRAPRAWGDSSTDTVALGTLTVGTSLPTEWVLLSSQETGGQPREGLRL